jgi:hypothetical protein
MRSLPKPFKQPRGLAKRAAQLRSLAKNSAHFMSLARGFAADLIGGHTTAPATPSEPKSIGIWSEAWDATYEGSVSASGRPATPHGFSYH